MVGRTTSRATPFGGFRSLVVPARLPFHRGNLDGYGVRLSSPLLYTGPVHVVFNTILLYLPTSYLTISKSIHLPASALQYFAKHGCLLYYCPFHI